jgi:hypothetical protein
MQAVHREPQQAGFDQVVARELDEFEVVGGHIGHANGVVGRFGTHRHDRQRAGCKCLERNTSL